MPNQDHVARTPLEPIRATLLCNIIMGITINTHVNPCKVSSLPQEHWMNLGELENGDQQVEIGVGQACGIWG